MLPRLPFLTFAYRLTLSSTKLRHPADPLRELELSRFGSLFHRPLRSRPITGRSTLLRVHLPPPIRPSLGLVGAPLATSGQTGIGGFSCSMTKPLVRSCRLYAGSGASNHLQFGNHALVPEV
jgi:hypothetical protein